MGHHQHVTVMHYVIVLVTVSCDDIDETCPAGKMELLQLSYQEVSRLSVLGWCQHIPNACTYQALLFSEY